MVSRNARMSWFLAIFALLSLTQTQAVQVTVPGFGDVLGLTLKSYLYNNDIHAFLGMRYANAPTTANRFLPPVPVDSLPEGEFHNGTSFGPICNQGKDSGEEDCLLLNVYTPELPNGTDPNIPVMVYIHGGGFYDGSTLYYMPFALLDRRVVLVVIQYRLSALGWLSLNIDEIPGNAGLYDQLEALRWVNKNIRAFGGNPDRVTIFGESAGAASVSLLMLVPQAQGLFHGVIGESGSATTPWAIDEDPIPDTLRIAELAGCPTSPMDELVSCLKTIPAANLTTACTRYRSEDRRNGGMGFGGSSAVIQVAGENRLITDDPLSLMERGEYNTEVPAIFGANKHEGTYVLGVVFNQFLVPNGLLNDTEFFKRECIELLLNTIYGVPPTSEQIDSSLDFFFSGLDTGSFYSMFPGFIDMTGTLLLKANTYQFVQLHQRNNPNAWMYGFNYEGRASLFPFIVGGQAENVFPHGVCHADELIYLFQFTPLFNETERHMDERMVQLWTNFAIYGDPTPEGVELFDDVPIWNRYTDENRSYLHIDLEFENRYDFALTYNVAKDEGFSTLVPGVEAEDSITLEEILAQQEYLKNSVEQQF